MKKTFLLFTLYFLVIGFSNSPSLKSAQENELVDCVIKYKSEWGRACSACKQEGKTYTVFLRNECNQAVDVKCAVQEAEKRWRTFVRLNLNPKDTMLAYACNGTGKYLYYVRKAGDKTNPLPEDDEINKQNPK